MLIDDDQEQLTMKRKKENAQMGREFNVPLREAGNKTCACDDGASHAKSHSEFKEQRIGPNLQHDIICASPNIPMAGETWN